MDIDDMLEDHWTADGVPKCPTCDTEWERVGGSEYHDKYESACDCWDNDHIQIMRG